ncbi:MULTISPECIES: hypothetical protein [unclassified Microcoleus]|uniref:hypothetical protein n=1 Tax=unclassified Microcoleus TaxID=2642155 RepID=UPI002FD6C68C
MNSYIVGIAIGCVAIFAWYKLSHRKKESTPDYTKLERRLNKVESQTFRNKFASERNTERIDAMENRQDRADEWFGSIIRHSRAQFDKEAVESFLKEQGLEEEE